MDIITKYLLGEYDLDELISDYFNALLPYLPNDPNRDWLTKHLRYKDRTLYLKQGKENFLNDIFDRWVKAVNNGEFSVRTLVQGKKDYRQLITIEDEGNGVWVEKDAPQERVSISFIGVPSSFGRA